MILGARGAYEGRELEKLVFPIIVRTPRNPYLNNNRTGLGIGEIIQVRGVYRGRDAPK